MAKQRERWVVEWVDRDRLARELQRVDSEGEPVYHPDDGTCEAMLQCESRKGFTTRTEAVVFAEKVLPLDVNGEVQIYREVGTLMDFGDGGPAVYDWEPVGDTEYITL